MLLVLTLFRLALNVSATRLVLLDGFAGKVIDTFGHFVVGGSLIVGLIVFAILLVIQFVVITNGAGRVCETPDAALFALDAGAGERIPRFTEAAALCRELGLLANVEIKPAAGHAERTGEVVAAEAARLWAGAALPPLLSSFDPVALAVARDVAPGLPRGILFEAVPDDWHACLTDLGAFSLHCDASGLADATLAEAAARGVPVLCYTVNEAEAAKSLFARGVAGLFTDRLDLFA